MPNMNKSHIWLVLILSTLLYTACSTSNDDNSITGPPGPKPGGSNSELITGIGGTVTYGDATLIFDEGSITGLETITLGVPESEPNYELSDAYSKIGYVYEGTPSDLDLQGQAWVAFIYSDDDIGNYIESNLTIMQYDAETDETTELGDIVLDTFNNSISASITSLGVYILAIQTDVNPQQEPQPPELISPYDGQTDVPLSVAFVWNGDSTVTAYHLQVALDENFNNLFFDFDGLTGELNGLGGFDPATTYYWRVRSRVDDQYSDWSDPFTFTTVEVGAVPDGIEGAWIYDWGLFTEINGDDLSPMRNTQIQASLLVLFLDEELYAMGQLRINPLDEATAEPTPEDDSYYIEIDYHGDYSVQNGYLAMDGSWLGAPAIPNYYEQFIDGYEIHIDGDQLMLMRYFDPPSISLYRFDSEFHFVRF